MQVETVKVKSESAEQGDFIIINKEDFDEKKHVLYEDATKSKKQVEK